MDVVSFEGRGLGSSLVPHEELADCAATALRADGARILSYGTGAGYTPLRELVAEQLDIHPFRIVLTNGWLQGFSLLAQGRVTAKSVVIEYPAYDQALQMLFRMGANIVYADWHEEGINLTLLADTLRVTPGVPLALITPNFNNPTGRCLTLEQRIRYCEIMRQYKVTVIEDDTYGLLRYDGEPLPSMFDILDGSAVYSSSFAATVAPGLQVGVFALPDDLPTEMTDTANSTYITPVLLAQATVFEFIRRGSFEPNLERLKEELRERRDTLLGALESSFGDMDGAQWTRPDGGIFVVLSLTPGIDAAKVVERAEGVNAAPGDDFGGMPHTIRLNFAGPASVDQIEPAIERLAAAARSVADDPPFTGY